MPLFLVDIDLSSRVFETDPYLEVSRILHRVADECASSGISAKGEHITRGPLAPGSPVFHLEIDLSTLPGQWETIVAGLLREVALKVELGREDGLIKLELTVTVGRFRCVFDPT